MPGLAQPYVSSPAPARRAAAPAKRAAPRHLPTAEGNDATALILV